MPKVELKPLTPEAQALALRVHELLKDAKPGQKVTMPADLAQAINDSALEASAPAILACRRMEWLHSRDAHNVDGYEWGIFRVKWENGRAMEVLQTLSDCSDLDAAMGTADERLDAGSDTSRLDWLLPNLHPANFGLEFPGGYEWDNEAALLRKWRSAIDAEIGATGAAYGKTNHTGKHTVSEADIDAEIRRSGCLRTDENRAVVRAQLEAARGVSPPASPPVSEPAVQVTDEQKGESDAR